MYSNSRLWSRDSSPCPEREDCEEKEATVEQDPCKPHSSPEYEASRHTSNSGNFSSSAQSNNNSPYHPSCVMSNCGSYSYASCSQRCPPGTRPFYVSGNRSSEDPCEVMDVMKARAAKRCRERLMNSRVVKIKCALMTCFILILFLIMASYWIHFNKSGEVLALMVLLLVTVVVQKPSIFLPDLIWNS